MKLSKLMMAFAMCAVTLTGTAQTKVIAHRGYWKCEGSAQNSIASLTKAAEAKVYGSEFDVQLTKDKEIVVNHDDSIQGICIFDTPFAELKDLKLSNGEKLSTLDDYLVAGKKLTGTQLILEIKPHRTEEAESEKDANGETGGIYFIQHEHLRTVGETDSGFGNSLSEK